MVQIGFCMDCIILFFLSLFILRERERERARAEEGQREGEEDPKQALCFHKEPDVGLNLTNHEIMI